MPVIQRAVSVPANSTVENLVAGSQFEFARRASVLSIGLIGAAAGLNAVINNGGDVVAEQFPVNNVARWPIIPDDFVFNSVSQPNDRLSITATNTTGAAIVAYLIVQIQEI